jgi:pimeloyl-ACP methyl ester carboxylesterase
LRRSRSVREQKLFSSRRAAACAGSREIDRRLGEIGEDGLLVWKTDPAVNSGGATGGPSGGRVIQMWSFYQRVKAPVLIVRGAESTALTRETVSKMFSVLPGTRAVEVPGAGHTP